MPIISIIVMVPRPKHELLPGIFASIPAVIVVALPTGREPAIGTAKDVDPATILTDLTVPWTRLGFASLVFEVVVVTTDLQPLLKLC